MLAILINLQPAIASEQEAYYRNKTITYIVSSKAGGGYDTYARLIARYMEKYLSGTKIRIKNVPGAGGLIAVNHLSGSEPDGLTIGTFNSGVIYAQLLQAGGARFDLTQFGWIGKAASDSRVMLLSSRSRFKSLEDLISSETAVLLAASGVGSMAYTETRLMKWDGCRWRSPDSARLG